MRNCFFADEEVRCGFLGRYFSTTVVMFKLVGAIRWSRGWMIERRTMGASKLGTGSNDSAVSCTMGSLFGITVGDVGRLGG